jgi:hypothetical protein
MTAASNEVVELIKRLRRGADHLESEGDLGMPFLLREAANALADSDPRPVAEGLREAERIQTLEAALASVRVNLMREPSRGEAVGEFAAAILRGSTLIEAMISADTRFPAATHSPAPTPCGITHEDQAEARRFVNDEWPSWDSDHKTVQAELTVRFAQYRTKAELNIFDLGYDQLLNAIKASVRVVGGPIEVDVSAFRNAAYSSLNDPAKLIRVIDAKGYVTLHEPDEDGNPGDLVASVWRDDWIAPLVSATHSPAPMAWEGWHLQPVGDPVALNECPPGPFEFNGSLGFKTEYGAAKWLPERDAFTVSHWPDPYCLDSGEAFWGGVSGQEARAALVVQPLAAAHPSTQEGGDDVR